MVSQKQAKVEDSNFTRETIQLFNRHPGLLLTSAYAVVTFIGISYYYQYYRLFNIPILKLTDFSDILVAGVREPMVILMFLAALVTTLAYDKMIRVGARVQSELKQQEQTFSIRLRSLIVFAPKSNNVIYGLLVACLIFVLYFWIQILTSHRAEQILNGQANRVIIEKTDSKENKAEMILLGTTTNYVISFNPTTGESVIDTIESIVSIKPTKPKQVANAK
ncbi:MAG: hypothetical protein OQJ89_04920 [Kangiellaceae bacterium]|nr:hypothetical protein [Kangiellaceae bacterium]MCW9016285.1 hypothetical protein [Kangiellaceae bacterium]